MDVILDLITNGARELVERFDGPLHFRLIVMPTVVTLVAIRAGIRDARERKPAYFWALLTNSEERPKLLRTALKDIGRMVLVAVVLDTAYQLFVLRAFHVGQLVIVVVVCAIVPYVLVRGPSMRIARAFGRSRARREPDDGGQS
ncbi:MAG: hypothetical protein P1V36_14195 [Planctomycetota bacterium]|nr:hypothetical protein [Planctomycetota bacterium]